MKRIIALMMVLVMIMGCFAGCGKKESVDAVEDLAAAMEVLDEAQELLQEAEDLQEELEKDTETETPILEETDPGESEEAEQPEEADGGMRSEFKEAMDSYETFMDEYVAFMEKYNEDPSDLSLLADYSVYLGKYAEFVEDFEKWENDEMNDAEMSYYIDVQNRVSKKLLEVAE